MPDTLYFAYGSNLSVQQIKHRCPDTVLVQQYNLAGWELAFCPPGDIRENQNAVVPGALYRLSLTDEAVMDTYEVRYSKIYFDVTLDNGTTERCMTYIAGEREKWVAPRDDYFNRIRIGYDDWNIPYDALFTAYKKSVGDNTAQPPIGDPRPIDAKPQKKS